jgi:sugar phosphate isomerase/epimerase
MRRRDLLKSAAILAAGASMSTTKDTQVHLGCQTNAWPIDAGDFSNVLAIVQKLRDYGYEGFETGFANLQDQFEHAAEAKRKLDAIGIKFFGVHIFLTDYDPETRIAPATLYERVAAGAAALGAEYLILSGAPAGSGVKRKAAALNQAGTYASKAGLKLAYHNHSPELEKNGSEIEALISGTDPTKVGLLLDAGHAFRAGADVPAFVRKHEARLIGMHLRDFKNGEQVPLGGGEFPLAAVADAVKRSGWSGWVLNEEERLTSKPGDAAVQPAHDALFRAFRA